MVRYPLYPLSESKSSLPYDDEDDRELFENLFPVASSMECTGLIPAAPESASTSSRLPEQRRTCGSS